MGDAWIIRTEDENERLYLVEYNPIECWTAAPERAETFSNARARAVIRELGPRPGLKAVRRFTELAGA